LDSTALKETGNLGRLMSHSSLQKKSLTVPSDLHYYVQKEVQLLSLLLMNDRIVFVLFLNKSSAMSIINLFLSAIVPFVL
jgi:hypothetical protein